MAQLVSIALTGIAVAVSIAYLVDELRHRKIERAPSAQAEAARMLAALHDAAAKQPAGSGPPIVVVPADATSSATNHLPGRDRSTITVIVVLVASNAAQLAVHLAG